MKTLKLMVRSGLGLLALTMYSIAAVAQEQGPRDIVQDLATGLLESVVDNREEYRANPDLLFEKVRAQLKPHIDILYSGRLVLGRQSRNLAPEQIESFSTALGELLLTRYAEGLLEFDSRDQLEVLELAGRNTERATRVRTRVRLPNGNKVPVDYVFRKHEGVWKVFDVVIEGISYVQTYRTQIGQQIREEGFDSVLAGMQSGEIQLPDTSSE